MKTILHLWFAFLIFFLGAPTPSSGQIIDVPRLIGVNRAVDQAFDRFKEALDRARNAALAIEYQTNADVTERIKQIGDLADRTLSQLREMEGFAFSQIAHLLDQATNQANTLEQTFMRDLLNAINQIECAGNRLLNQSLADALGGFGRLIGANQIEISAPLLYDTETQGFFCNNDKCRLKKTFSIATPFSTTYRDIKKYLFDRLENAREDTPRYTVVVTYSLIAQLAKRTACFFPGAEMDYIRDFDYYINRARAWDIVPETRR